MKELSFFVECTPRAKGRPRFARMGNFIKVYSAKKTIQFEKLIAAECKSAMGAEQPLSGAVHVSLKFHFPPPTKWKKAAREAPDLIPHTTAPDIDNLCKSVLDGLNGIAWDDDCQVCSVVASKAYSLKPGVYIVVMEGV